MSSLDVAPIHRESDSEDDQDYVLEGEGQDSDTCSDTSEERDVKRPRFESPPPTEEDIAEANSMRQALWAKFQDSVNAPSTPPERSEPKRTVKVEKRHRFAGEEVVEVVDVPEDSADAKKWSLWKPPNGQDEIVPHDSGSGIPTPSTEETPPLVAASPTSVAPSQTLAKRPGRRKPKVHLAEPPSAGSQKGKKLTTLEMSALEWKAHVNTSGEPELASELEANRRGGGYLEKVEFLQRVGDRKNETLEANKDPKRRRG